MTEMVFFNKDEGWDDPGFTRMPNIIARDSRLSLEARGLILFLASHAAHFQLSFTRLMHESQCGRDRLRRIMAELVDNGYLEKRQRTDEITGRLGVNTYRLRSRRSVPSTENPSTVVETEIPRSAPSTDYPSTAHPSTENTTPYKKNTSKKTSLEEDQKNTPSPADAGDEAFDAFWAAYPRKVGKIKARAEWRKAIKNGADPLHLIAAAGRYSVAVAPNPKRYTKHPVTWLGHGCFDDEDLPEPASIRTSPLTASISSSWDSYSEADDPWAARG